MARKISIAYSAIGGTRAGMGCTPGGHHVVADRPQGVAGGNGLGLNGGELLASALAGCFWNDLHYVADGLGADITVHEVVAEITLGGDPVLVTGADIRARLTSPNASRIFDGACAASTIANSLKPAFPVTFALVEATT